MGSVMSDGDRKRDAFRRLALQGRASRVSTTGQTEPFQPACPSTSGYLGRAGVALDWSSGQLRQRVRRLICDRVDYARIRRRTAWSYGHLTVDLAAPADHCGSSEHQTYP